MNCHQCEKLLPLYVGGELDERRERLLEAHLQSCAGCVATNAEYRETREMLQQFASSNFDQDVYAQIRENVWQQIEAESISPSLSELVGSWFRPRLVWAAMAALLIAFSAIGIYFSEKRWTGPKPLAGKDSQLNQNTRNEAPPKPTEEEPRNSALAANEESNRPRSASRRHLHQRMNRNGIQVLPESIAINSPGATSISTQEPSPLPGVPQSDIADESTKTLRLELQTQNPNIRIIWFSQRDSKQMSPNSKGT